MPSYTFRVTSGFTSEEVCCTTLDCTATVRALKKNIEEATGIRPQAQRLLMGERVMKDRALLEDLIPVDSSVHREIIEISLVQSSPSEDPYSRKRNFEGRYLDHPIRSGDVGRWDYHRTRVETETDLDHGFSKRKRLYIKVHYDANHETIFNVCSLDFPLSELFDTFAEQLGMPLADLHFSFQGMRLGREHTPHLCGMEPCSLEAAYDIQVKRADGQGRRQHLLGTLNSMGDAVKLKPCALSVSTAQAFLGADNLTNSLLFLPLEDLLSTTLVNAFWFHATQRLSLLLQLRHGDLAFVTTPPEEYTSWLTSVFGHSQHLALAEAQSRHREVQIWQGLKVSKERMQKAYSFTKAAGCTTMKTVSLSGMSDEFEHQWLSLHSSKSKFMAECKAWCQNDSVNSKNREKAEEQPQQHLPPPGSRNFSTDIVSSEFRAVAVEMFRRYFSPDMYFIFPLIVGKEAGFGLDFRSTTTTLFFGPQDTDDAVPAKYRPPALAHLAASAMPAPAGACSWRFRWPLSLQPRAAAAPELEQPLPLLEVLFIAVWEEERYQVHGGGLVADLEEKARTAGAKMMYVEIGFEQPKARRFWRKQGFGKAVRMDLKDNEKRDLEKAEEEEDVPMPLVPLLDAQFDFFEGNCLRFSDTAQYVKLL